MNLGLTFGCFFEWRKLLIQIGFTENDLVKAAKSSWVKIWQSGLVYVLQIVVEEGVENPRTGSTYDVSYDCVLSFYCISIDNLF